MIKGAKCSPTLPNIVDVDLLIASSLIFLSSLSFHCWKRILAFSSASLSYSFLKISTLFSYSFFKAFNSSFLHLSKISLALCSISLLSLEYFREYKGYK